VAGAFPCVTTAARTHAEARPPAARHGITMAWDQALGFPVPGHLAGTHPSQPCECSTSGPTPGLPGRGAHRSPLSLASADGIAESPPDLPSNRSSLRDLDCSHSNYKTQKSPVSVFIVTTSPYRDWVICAPAAFLGCGSRFSGSLSGIEP
jgi:hypothetical protein